MAVPTAEILVDVNPISVHFRRKLTSIQSAREHQIAFQPTEVSSLQC